MKLRIKSYISLQKSCAIRTAIPRINNIKNVLLLGIVADANYKDSNGRFFRDAEMTIPSTDVTTHIQEAIDSSVGKTLYFPAGNYLVNVDYGGGLEIKSNSRLVFGDGANIYTKGTYRTAYSLIKIVNKQNITIIGGNFIGDRYHHKVSSESDYIWRKWEPSTRYEQGDYLLYRNIGYYISSGGVSSDIPPTHDAGVELNGTVELTCSKGPIQLGESGHGVFIGNLYGDGQINPNTNDVEIQTNNIKIINSRFSDFWGDGICFVAYHTDGIYYDQSRDIYFDGIVSSNNRRQGMSIVSAKDVVIKNSQFINTNGTSPEAGIDIEPNKYNRVENILIENCDFNNNNGNGIFVLGNDENSIAQGVEIKDCNIINNGKGCLTVGSSGRTSDIYVNNIYCEQKQGNIYAPIIVSNAKNVNISDVVIENSADVSYIATVGSSEKCVLKNIYANNKSNGGGIAIAFNINDVEISDCYIKCTNDAIVGNIGLQYVLRQNLRIINNELYSESDRGINITDFAGLFFDGNTIAKSNRQGIVVSNSSDIVIRYNNVENSCFNEVTSYSAIHINHDCSNFSVIGNKVRKAVGSNIAWFILIWGNDGIVHYNDVFDESHLNRIYIYGENVDYIE